MSSFRILMISLCVFGLTAGAIAQDTEAETPRKAKAESFLKHIPAGTMGFYATNNLEATLKHVEKYLADIGVDELMQMDFEEAPGTLLSLLKMSAKFGDGFNPNGGIVMVMLDPEQFDIDLPKAVENDKMPEKLPYVVFVAGSGVDEVFGAYEPEKDGDYTKLMLPMGEMVAASCGDYVLLSPMKEAIKAVIEAKTKATEKELSKKQIELFKKSDVSVYVNMRVAGPIFNGMIKAAEKAMKEEAEDPDEYVSSEEKMFMTFAPAGRDIISQLDAICITGRIAKDGVIFDAICDWVPDSDIGKALAAFKAPTKPLLSRVPDLAYIIAAGSSGLSGVDTFDAETMKAYFENMELEEEHIAQAEKLTKAWTEQVNGTQMVIGQGPKDTSLLGVTMVIECKDADKTKKLLVETATFYVEIIAFMADDDDIAQLEISYKEGVETIGETKLDAININHPELDNLSDKTSEIMTKVFGEDKIRLLVASPDKNTVVITFGGTKTYMEKALDTVKYGKASVLVNKDAQKSLKHMPRNACFVFVGNAGNLFKTIGSIMEAAMGGNPIPFDITCQTPVAVGIAVEGTSTHLAAFVPTDLVRECIDAYKKMEEAQQQQRRRYEERNDMDDEGEDF